MRIARLAAAMLAAVLILTPAAPATAQGRRAPSNQFDRAYKMGYSDGAHDARQGRAFELDREKQARRGSREFRNGYAEGYRAGFESFRPSRSRSVVRLPNLQGRSG